jgi:regulatory protein
MKRQITDIQVQKKYPSRRSIFLDGKFFCGVSEDVAARFHLERGMEIDEDKLKELLYEEELSKAKSYVYGILARRMYTTREIRDKLVEREYVDKIIEDVIATLERYGYLNDRTYAQEWIESRMRSKPKGKIALKRELERKGIDRSIIEEALSQAFDQSKESEMALDLARRKARSYNADDPVAAKRKLQSFLIRRGFDFETVKDVIEQVIDSNE